MKVAVASGKGGTGKTTLSVNLASFIAESDPVVLVDLDVEEPDSALFIKPERKNMLPIYKDTPFWNSETCQLCGKCQLVCAFNAILKLGNEILVFPQLCHSCHACTGLCPTGSITMQPVQMGELSHSNQNNLSYVESRLLLGEEQAVPLIKQTMHYVSKIYSKDMLFLFDSPPGTSCPVIEVMLGSDLIILVTEPTTFGLHDISLAVETAKSLDKCVAVVINKAGIGDNGVYNYCQENNIPIIAQIPNQREIAEMCSKGELIYHKFPDVHREIKKITSYIAEFQVT